MILDESLPSLEVSHVSTGGNFRVQGEEDEEKVPTCSP